MSGVEIWQDTLGYFELNEQSGGKSTGGMIWNMIYQMISNCVHLVSFTIAIISYPSIM